MKKSHCSPTAKRILKQSCLSHRINPKDSRCLTNSKDIKKPEIDWIHNGHDKLINKWTSFVVVTQWLFLVLWILIYNYSTRKTEFLHGWFLLKPYNLRLDVCVTIKNSKMMPREYKLKIRTFHSYVYFLFLGSSYTRPGRGEGTCFSPSQNMQVSCEHFHSYRIY